LFALCPEIQGGGEDPPHEIADEAPFSRTRLKGKFQAGVESISIIRIAAVDIQQIVREVEPEAIGLVLPGCDHVPVMDLRAARRKIQVAREP
jgi:hypothetical protein